MAQDLDFALDRIGGEPTASRLRLQTIIRLRWFAVLGQLLAVTIVYFGMKFELPIGWCLLFISISAWLNVFLRLRYPARYRLNAGFATTLLAYDIAQLAALLFLTGGIENPFAVLLVAPVTVSAATLPPRHTIFLGGVGLSAAALLVTGAYPLPWYGGQHLDLPTIYKVGLFAAVAACMIFLALYGWRLSKEGRQMSAALAATELVLAREQKLHALDGLAAAAAHELGTPLATIVLVTKELERDLPPSSPIADDVALLRNQAQRCRDILQKLTARPTERDPLHASLSVSQLIEEAVGPHRVLPVKIEVDAKSYLDGSDQPQTEPVGERRPGLIYGVGNLIENAVEFANIRVSVVARWNEREVMLTISDDGPGFPPDVMDSLGEPYVTTRRPTAVRNNGGKAAGLGLGFFIAKTLLERSGARLELANQEVPAHGAIVRVTWARHAFEGREPEWSAFPGRNTTAAARSTPAI